MNTTFRSRIVEDLITARLKTHGGVLITGTKAVGKTTTARRFAASEVRLDQDRAALTAARTDPRLVLDGDTPRLIDEYQLVEGLWEAVRGRIDDLHEKALFLLTGSATPDENEVLHAATSLRKEPGQLVLRVSIMPKTRPEAPLFLTGDPRQSRQ